MSVHGEWNGVMYSKFHDSKVSVYSTDKVNVSEMLFNLDLDSVCRFRNLPQIQ